MNYRSPERKFSSDGNAERATHDSCTLLGDNWEEDAFSTLLVKLEPCSIILSARCSYARFPWSSRRTEERQEPGTGIDDRAVLCMENWMM